MPPTDRAGPAVAAPGHPAAAAPVAPSELPPLFDAGRRRLLLALVGVGLLQAALAAGAALGVRAMVDAWGIGTRATVWAPGPWAPWVAWGVVVIACALIVVGLRVAAGRWSESLGQRYVAAVRLALMHHLFRLPPRRHQQMRHGHLMARLTGDLAALHRWAGRTVAPLLVASASFVLLAATLAWLAPAVAAGAAAACAPLVGVAWWASVRLERSLRAERVQRWALAGQVGERLAEAAVVQVHGQAGRELRRLRRRQQRLHDAAVLRVRHAAVLKAMPPAAGLLVMGLLAGWGGAQVAAGAWSGGTLAGLLTLCGLVLAPLRDFALGLGNWRSWRVSREKLTGFLHQPPLPDGQPDGAAPPQGAGVLRLDGLVAVPGMAGVTAQLRRGDTAAVQGVSGSGKSALLQALAGWLVPAAGRVLYEGDPGAESSAPAARGVLLVAADLPLLRGSVAGNLRYLRKSARNEELMQALRAAGVSALPAGAGLSLGSPVFEGGRNLPRVLRARLALARALVDPPAVLLIDDFDDLLDGDAAADAPLAMLLAQPPCTIVIATRRPDWAGRCAQRWPLGPLPEAGPPRVLELAHAA
jgi:ABC-type multidrug transport system fused ATPase/permease subunit